jgi:hypothetical protein
MKDKLSKPVSMKAFIAVTLILLAISVVSIVYAAQILTAKTWSTVGGQVYLVTGDTSVTSVTLPYALADNDITAQSASVDLTAGTITNGYTSIAQGHWILEVKVTFSSTAAAGTYTVTVSKMVAGAYASVGAITCTVTLGGNPDSRTVSFYYDYGADDIPASTGLLITVEKTT